MLHLDVKLMQFHLFVTCIELALDIIVRQCRAMTLDGPFVLLMVDCAKPGLFVRSEAGVHDCLLHDFPFNHWLQH